MRTERKTIQKSNGDINFTTNTWTLLNHKAYIALSAHFHLKGKLVALLLDIVEVARPHTGRNIAEAPAEIFKAFGIAEKVSFIS